MTTITPKNARNPEAFVAAFKGFAPAVLLLLSIPVIRWVSILYGVYIAFTVDPYKGLALGACSYIVTGEVQSALIRKLDAIAKRIEATQQPPIEENTP